MLILSHILFTAGIISAYIFGKYARQNDDSKMLLIAAAVFIFVLSSMWIGCITLWVPGEQQVCDIYFTLCALSLSYGWRRRGASHSLPTPTGA